MNYDSAPAIWLNNYEDIATHSVAANRTLGIFRLSTYIKWGDNTETLYLSDNAGISGAFPRYIDVAGEITGTAVSINANGLLSGLPVIGFDEYGVCDALYSTSVNLGNRLVTLATAQTITAQKTFTNNTANTGGSLIFRDASNNISMKLSGNSQVPSITTDGVNYSYINVPVSFGNSGNLYFYNRGYINSSTAVQYPEYATLHENYVSIKIAPGSSKISLHNGKDANTNAETIILSGINGTGTYTGRVSSPEFYVSSDSRLKENKVKLTDFDDDVNIYEYTWKDSEKEDKLYGFIAQEVSKNYPQFIESGETDEGYMTVNYNSAICLTLAKLYKKIEELEQEIKELKSSK